MTKYKRQHWVPQSYLRRFSPDQCHVWMLDKPTDRVAFSNTRDVAQGKYFNDGFLRDEQGKLPSGISEDLIERQFSIWENHLSKMIEVALRVAAGEGADLESRIMMALCVAIQLARTPTFRLRLWSGLFGLLEDDANKYFAEHLPEAAEKFTVALDLPPEWSAAIHHHSLWSSDLISKIATDLCRYIWLIGVNRSVLPLCTSDTPVIRFFHDAVEPCCSPEVMRRPDDFVREVLAGNRPLYGIEIIFPLTPEVVLLMYHPRYFAHLQPVQGQRLKLDLDQVLHYNALQLLDSNRHVFSYADTFQTIREYATTYSQINL